MIEINKNKLVPAITATWGDITGNIEKQQDLMSMMSSFATESWVSSKNYLTSSSLKTINNQSIVGSGNIEIEASVPDYYATKAWVSEQGYLTSETLPSDLATESWVSSQGYITTSALSGYATESWVSSQGYLTSVPDSFATKSWVSEQGYLTSETLPSDLATESWVVSQNYITSSALSGYATQYWVDTYVESQHYLTEEDPIIAPLLDSTQKYAPAAAVWENLGELIGITTGDSNFRKYVFNIGGEIYFYKSDASTKIYKFNKTIYKFEYVADAAALTENYGILWEDLDGHVYLFDSTGNTSMDHNFIINLSTGEMEAWNGFENVPFSVHNTTNKINIYKVDSAIFCADQSTGYAYQYVKDGDLHYFDWTNPITYSNCPKSNIFRYTSFLNGVNVTDSGGYLYQLEYQYHSETPELTWVQQETPIYPALDGTLPGAQYVVQYGSTFVYMYLPNIYKLVDGEWINLGIDFSNAPAYRGNPCGVVWSEGEMLMGWAYKLGDTTPYLLMINLSYSAKSVNNIVLSIGDMQSEIDNIKAELGSATDITNNILS